MKKLKVVFVCHGNICRSPMAEYILKKMVSDKGLDDRIEVYSRATSSEEIGNDIYPPAKQVLKKHNIPFGVHHATRIKREEYADFDYILYMEDYNLRNMVPDFNDDEGEILKLGVFGLGGEDIDDPWYSGNFELTFIQIYTCCTKLMGFLTEQLDLIQ